MTGLLAGLRWYLGEISGQGRYQRYVDRCRGEGSPPLERAAYERNRSDHRDSHPEGRCC